MRRYLADALDDLEHALLDAAEVAKTEVEKADLERRSTVVMHLSDLWFGIGSKMASVIEHTYMYDDGTDY